MTLADALPVISIIVSAVAAFYAYKAPIRAAERSEELRLQAAVEDQKRAIFNVLMAERGRWGSPNMISALMPRR